MKKIEAYIAEVLASFPVGRILDIHRIRQGFANLNYDVTTEKGRFLVRFAKGRAPEEVEKEVRLLQVLKRHALPVVSPLSGGSGRIVCLSEIAPVVVFPFVEGQHPVPGERVIRQIGRMLGHLHSIPPEEIPEKKNSIDPAGCEQTIRDHPVTPCLDPHLKDQWLRSFEKMRPCLSLALPRGLIHGDLFPDNTLFMNGELVAVLDFEEYAIDHFLFDIAMTVNGFCLTDDLPDPHKIAVLLSEYEMIRPLIPAERRCLDAYIAWTALGMACWHVRDCEGEGKPGQRDRIRQLIRLAGGWWERRHPE